MLLIIYMQVPRYDSLKSLLSKVLQQFLTLELPKSSTSVPELEQGSTPGLEQRTPKVEAVTSMETILQERVRALDNYLYESLPRNRSDREKLLECGYSAKLWDEVI